MIKQNFTFETIHSSARKWVTHGTLFGLLVSLFAVVHPAAAQNHLNDYHASSGVSFTSFQNSLFMAFAGRDSARSINIGQSSDALNWSAQWQVSDNHGGTQHTTDTPAIAYFKGKVYLAWLGSPLAGGFNLNIASSTDAHTFTDATILDAYVAHGVAMYGTPTRLYIAWAPQATSPPVNAVAAYMYSDDGVTWSSIFTVGTDGPSPFTPMIGVYGTGVYMSYTQPPYPSGPSQFNQPRFPVSLIGSTQTVPIAAPTPSQFPAGINSCPSFVWDGGANFFLAWMDNNGSVFYNQYTASNGTYVLNMQNVPTGHTGFHSPTVIGNWNGHSYVSFAGKDTNSTVNILTIK